MVQSGQDSTHYTLQMIQIKRNKNRKQTQTTLNLLFSSRLRSPLSPTRSGALSFFWSTCITADITWFFPLIYWFVDSNLSSTYHPPPLRFLTRSGGCDSFFKSGKKSCVTHSEAVLWTAAAGSERSFFLISFHVIFIHRHFFTPWNHMVTNAVMVQPYRVLLLIMRAMGCDVIPNWYSGSRDGVFIRSLVDYGPICYGLYFPNVSQTKGA